MAVHVHLSHVHLKPLKGRFEADLANGEFFGLGKGEVAVENRRVKGKGVHVFGAGGKNLGEGFELNCVRGMVETHLSSARKLRALGFCFRRCLAARGRMMSWCKIKDGNTVAHDNDGNTHEFEEFPALFIVLARDADRTPGELVDLLDGADFLCLLALFLCLLAFFETFRELWGEGEGRVRQ